MTMARASARWRWILPTAAVVFGALALGAMAGWLVWDEPITRWVIDARTSGFDAAVPSCVVSRLDAVSC